jgi:hypothetical protein
MATIASLSLNLSANLKGFSGGLTTAANQVDKFYADVGKKVGAFASPVTNVVKAVAEIGKAFKGLAGSALKPLAGIGQAIGTVASAVPGALSLIGKLAGGVTAAALGAGVALGAIATGGLDRIDQLGDAAQRIGVTTQALSELRFAAQLSGSSAEDLDVALVKLTTNLGDASLKATPTSEALKRIGLDAKQLANETPDDAFRQIVKGLESVPNAADKASIAMDVFGKGGVKILNTLGSGSAELDRLSADARAFGVSISAIDAAKVGQTKDALDKVSAVIEGVVNQISIALAPAIGFVADLFTDWFKSSVAGSDIFAGVMRGIVTVVGFVIDVGAVLKDTYLRVFANIALAAGQAVSLFSSSGNAIVASANKIFADLQVSQDAGAPSVALLAKFDAYKAKMDATAAATVKAADAARGAQSATTAVGEAIKKATDKLKEQIDTFGKTSSELEIYKLKVAGATDEELKGLTAMSDKLKALEKQGLPDFAKGLADRLKNPVEKYREELGKLRDSFNAGLIDKSALVRGFVSAQKELGGTTQKFAGAIDVGSKEARSNRLAATTGRTDGIKALEKATLEGTAAQKETVTVLGQIKGILASPSGEVRF